MQAPPVLASRIQANFEELRSAVEGHRYEDIEGLLQEQRAFIEILPITDPEARDILHQAQELTSWSLMMVKMQRSALEQNLAGVTKMKHMEGYRRSEVRYEVAVTCLDLSAS